MDYVVLARKYRPQRFDDVTGQDVIAATLSSAITKGRVAHAYLFTGPRGVGKTSTARILAKALNCDQGPTPTPCGVCDHCRMIADTRHPDVYEIDAATHNGVDAIRELTESISFSPTLARQKILILDEVHMLSNQAWNALLKSLEEPPPHVRFIFCTTEVDKVLGTVQSRCQRFDFRGIDLDAIVARLRMVCEGESMTVDDAMLYRIARAAGGGMRDAQTLLDQLIAVTDGQVDERMLNQLLGAARGEDLDRLVDALMQGDTAAAIARLDDVCRGGVAPSSLLDQLVERFRLIMLVQACGADAAPVTRLGGANEASQALATRISPDKILRVAQILIGAQQQVAHGVDAQLQLELAFVRIARAGDVLDVEGLLRKVDAMERGAVRTGPR